MQKEKLHKEEEKKKKKKWTQVKITKKDYDDTHDDNLNQ